MIVQTTLINYIKGLEVGKTHYYQAVIQAMYEILGNDAEVVKKLQEFGYVPKKGSKSLIQKYRKNGVMPSQEVALIIDKASQDILTISGVKKVILEHLTQD